MLAELEQAWRELDADPDGAGDRQHRQRHGVPDRARRRAAEPRPGGAARAVAPHPRRRAEAHRVAQPGVEAGDRRGQRHVRRRRPALRGRRRHRHRRRRTPRSSIRTCRSARSPPTRPSRLVRKSPMEPIMRMALVGRHERVSAAAGPPARHPQRGRRPARAAARRGPGAGREDRPELAGRHGRHQAGAVGRARARPHRRLPGRRGRARRHVGPPRPDRGPAGLHREARAATGSALDARRRRPHDDATRPTTS